MSIHYSNSALVKTRNSGFYIRCIRRYNDPGACAEPGQDYLYCLILQTLFHDLCNNKYIVLQGEHLVRESSMVPMPRKAKFLSKQVSLQKDGSHFCGGSILNEIYVVTAAHCVRKSSPSAISIVVGTLEYRKPGQIRQGVKITMHEGFSPPNSFTNDVALIKISHPFEFNKLVQPVTLPDSHTKIDTNSTAVVSGWGRLGGATGGISNTLKKAQI
ncbi:hypothetical protein TSAR_003377 [Trichomalopsis sarcophagae]|uniref:Peptidase S1 domain-containing protein n=1 Tax=Trichomalopsis sarcophagae TaxID=543379 RepID=A0A232ETZ4_9HYME|nr:hypothetical protein TSAR_003377 [Trichomalopsis sarcophagae]